jgi:hypothetical protein
MRPLADASVPEIIRIRDLAAGRLLGLVDAVRDAVAVAIGDRFFLRGELQPQLLLHVGRGGPAHERLDLTRRLGFEHEQPLFGIGLTRLHRGARRLVDAGRHSDSQKCRFAKARPEPDFRYFSKE